MPRKKHLIHLSKTFAAKFILSHAQIELNVSTLTCFKFTVQFVPFALNLNHFLQFRKQNENN